MRHAPALKYCPSSNWHTWRSPPISVCSDPRRTVQVRPPPDREPRESDTRNPAFPARARPPAPTARHRARGPACPVACPATPVEGPTEPPSGPTRSWRSSPGMNRPSLRMPAEPGVSWSKKHPLDDKFKAGAVRLVLDERQTVWRQLHSDVRQVGCCWVERSDHTGTGARVKPVIGSHGRAIICTLCLRDY